MSNTEGQTDNKPSAYQVPDSTPEYLEKLHDKNLIWEQNGLRLRQCRYGLMLYNQQDMYVGRFLDVYGEYMDNEARVFQHFLKPGDVAIDLGANIGAHTVAIATGVGPQGHVLAFEPQRYCYNLLTANITLNNYHNVRAFQTALSDKAGFIDVPYVVPAKNTNLTSSAGMEFWQSLKQAGKAQVSYDKVACNIMDNIQVNKCDFIKIDVEGQEINILQGGQNFIRKHRPVMFVEDDRHDKSQDLRNMLWELDYRLYMTKSSLFYESNFFDVKDNVFLVKREGRIVNQICSNLVCIPKESSAVCPDNIEGIQTQAIPTP